jgi:hypothetical protein
MSATNYTPIYLYNSGTATNTPLAANLGAGELAINYADGKLFYKDGSAAVQVIAWKTTPTTAGGTGLTSYTAGDLPYYASGSALSKLGIGTANYVLTSSGTAPQYVAQSTLSVGSATNATNTAITDNTSSSATWYPTIVSATTGNLPQTTSSTKLSFVPSTGTLTATSYGGAWAGSTIGTTYGGTGLTSFTANGVVYASSTSALATSSAFTFNGTDVGFTGNLVPGTAAKGINFTANTPASGMTSQLLNWYEEGTWTAAFVPLSGSITMNSSYNTGYYTRVGRLVTIGLHARFTSVSSPSGTLSVTGLPFTSNSNVQCRNAFSIAPLAIGTTALPMVAYITNNQTSFIIAGFNGSAGGYVAAGGYITATSEIYITGSYYI